jgi:MPBQ/MSBQ methyltransferase
MRRKHIDYGLKFLHQVMGLDALHLGMWEEGMPYSLAGVRAAQEKYTDTLIGLIPAGVRSVLDVGCGSGATSAKLLARGFEVEGLSPDSYHGELYAKRNGPGVRFHLAKFEDLRVARTYDCLLFSESPQYIAKDRFFPKCLELLGRSGHVIASDFFQIAPCQEYHMCFVEDDFVGRAKLAGFELVTRLDITKDVVRTQEYSIEILRHAQGGFEFVVELVANEAPRLGRIAKWIFRKKIAAIRSLLYEKLPPRLTPSRFLETVRYVMFHFRRTAT